MVLCTFSGLYPIFVNQTQLHSLYTLDHKYSGMHYKTLLLTIMTITMGLTNAISQKEITLEDIWAKGTFMAQSIPGFNFMNDGRQYTLMEENRIEAYDITTGNKTQTIFNPGDLEKNNGFEDQFFSYSFSPDENLILLATGFKQVYRRSYLASYFIFDRKDHTVTALYNKGKQMNAHFSPDGNKIGFIFGNNLFYKDLKTDEITQITFDGHENEIINGATDWVYEEEFSVDKRTGRQEPDLYV